MLLLNRMIFTAQTADELAAGETKNLLKIYTNKLIKKYCLRIRMIGACYFITAEQ